MGGRERAGGVVCNLRTLMSGTAIATVLFLGLPSFPASAQDYVFNSVQIEGNSLIEPATILKFAGIAQGQALTAGQLNDAQQRLNQSGLFAAVELVPQGGTLVIRVVENATINIVSFEGNRRVDDDVLAEVIGSRSRKVYSAAQAEADAAAITQAYVDSGRLAARVEPKVIKRDDNKVDLVFEIREGRVTEVNRISFTGNRTFSDRRLRQALESKQAGLFRSLVQRDTFIADRTEFDKQLLTDFYRARGFIDAQVLGVTSEFSRERDAFFVTFNIREGQRYSFNNVSVVSEFEGVDSAAFAEQIRIRRGVYYSPNAIDNTIARMEAVGLEQGLNFLAVEPRITRNARDQTLDVVFVLSKGPRVFVERIDIEGNATTLDKVVRRQFRAVEGDPFNPREIRNSASRIRALGYFEDVEVETRPGTAEDRVIVDVNVEERPTGSLSFGASYSVGDGVGFNIGLSESNFLGRGQQVGLRIATTSDNQQSSFSFVEPYLLDRDLRFRFSASYETSDNSNSFYSTQLTQIRPSLEFPLSEAMRLEVSYTADDSKIFDVPSRSSSILQAEAARGSLLTSSLGYRLKYDDTSTTLDPNTRIRLEFGQDFAGFGGDIDSINTTGIASYQTRVLNEEVLLRAEFEGGALSTDGTDGSRIVDRFTGNGEIRGFETNGIGPRDLTAPNQDALGGNFFAVARFEAEFPIGLPEEYGITGGLFADIGSVWGLDNPGTVDDSLNLRSSIGFSVFWSSALGPLRFNFSKAIDKEVYDREQNFDLTVSTSF